MAAPAEPRLSICRMSSRLISWSLSGGGGGIFFLSCGGEEGKGEGQGEGEGEGSWAGAYTTEPTLEVEDFCGPGRSPGVAWQGEGVKVGMRVRARPWARVSAGKAILHVGTVRAACEQGRPARFAVTFFQLHRSLGHGALRLRDQLAHRWHLIAVTVTIRVSW